MRMMDGEKIKEEEVLISCHVRTAFFPQNLQGFVGKCHIFQVHDSISSP